MGFQVSPGVNVKEIDLTTIIPAVATTSGGIAGAFQWGPAKQRILVDSEANLRDLFGDPNDDTYEYFFTAANFLAYGNNLQVVRVCGAAAKNAGDAAGLLINNDEHYDSISNFTSNNWFAKYPGVLGNSLKVSTCDSSAAFSSSLSGVQGLCAAASVGATSLHLGLGSTGSLSVGDALVIVDATTGEHDAVKVTALSSAAHGATATITPALTKALTAGATVTRKWGFYNNVDSAPGTSDWSTKNNNATSLDELHVVVYDADGKWSGTEGTVLEAWPFMSKASNARTDQGGVNYYKEKLNKASKYIYWGGHVGSTNTAWGSALTGGSVFGTNDTADYSALAGGVDDNGAAAINNDILDVDQGYDLFKDAETVDVSLLLGGPGNAANGQFLIDEVCDKRKDCVAFLSPQSSDVVDVLNTTTQKDNVITYRNTTLNRSSSYAVLDSGYKYQFDRYNDVFRNVPLNGDVAGLCVRTDEVADPWFSPAGFNRGQIKRITRLSFNPRKAHRDALYKEGVNPVVSFPGQGVVLFGDKTLQVKPSAFDRINVRRLFIVLEKAIATAAKFQLFELNDSFTRAQFRNMVEPFLRDIQGRRGITDFKVVCDESNNTGEVIDRNEFVADIYVKPARSINFIQLNFIATRTGVDFSELTG